MKTLTLFLFLISSVAVAAAQVDPKDITIVTFQKQWALQLTVKDDMTIEQAFEHLDKLAKFRRNRIVVKDGQRYFRYGFTIKPKTFIIIKKKHGSRLKPIKLK
jgi:hypothetical protein